MAKCDMKMPEDFLLKISKLGSNFDSVADTVLQAGGEVVLKKVKSILIHNLKDKEHPKEPLTEDVVELLTTPLDLAGYKTAITEALYKGTKRNVESEKDAKNAPVG